MQTSWENSHKARSRSLVWLNFEEYHFTAAISPLFATPYRDLPKAHVHHAIQCQKPTYLMDPDSYPVSLN